MGETLLGRTYGLTPEEIAKAHQVLTASTAIPKTPYQMDLERKDRKPHIIPDVGDMVKIKSPEWYNRWKDGNGYVDFPKQDCLFMDHMSEFCGKKFIVENIIFMEPQEKRYKLDGVSWFFTPEMFEEVYPKQSSQDTFTSMTGKPLQRKTELVITKEQMDGYRKLILDTGLSTIAKGSFLTSGFSPAPGKDKSVLKQMKTTRFNKLKKL